MVLPYTSNSNTNNNARAEPPRPPRPPTEEEQILLALDQATLEVIRETG